MSDPDTRPAAQDPAPQIVTGQEAAQGRRGTGVFRILIISLVLVVLALFGLYALNGPRLSTHGGAGGQSGVVSHREADSFHAPEPAAKPAPANGTADSSNQPTPKP